MAYLSSSDIQVFPTTKRGGIQRSARLMSEENLVGIISHSTDYNSFVIAEPLEAVTSTLDFCIEGYFFRITDLQALTNGFTSATSIYAHISITSASVGTETYKELDGQDVDSYYQGISFESTDSGNDLKILEKVTISGTPTWVVPSASTVKYDYMHIGGTIDCGTV